MVQFLEEHPGLSLSDLVFRSSTRASVANSDAVLLEAAAALLSALLFVKYAPFIEFCKSMAGINLAY